MTLNLKSQPRFAAVLLCALLTGTALGAAARPLRGRDVLALSTSEFFKVRLATTRFLARNESAESARRLKALAADPHPLVRRVAGLSLQQRDASVPAPRVLASVISN